jgi:hypothetical protein
LMDEEWRTSPVRERFVHLATLHDQQQATIHLVKLRKLGEDDSGWQRSDPPNRPTSSRYRP